MRAPAAGQQGAADDRGGDGVELVEVAVGVLGRSRPGTISRKAARDAAAQAGQQVEVEPLAADVDTGEAAASALPPTAMQVRRWSAEHQPADDSDGREHQDQRRMPRM